MIRRSVAGVGIALGLTLLGCAVGHEDCDKTDDCNQHCNDLCEQLDACGMLPSALGADRRECRASCAVSTLKPSWLLATCGMHGSASWCGDDGDAGDAACVALSRCFSADLGIEAIGSADVGYSPCLAGSDQLETEMVASNVNDTHDAKSCEKFDESCTPATPEQLDELCAGYGLAEVRLETVDRVELLNTGSCSEVLGTPATWTVPVGHYRISLTLRSGPLATDSCFKIYGGARVVSYSQKRPVKFALFLPAKDNGNGHVHACEYSLDACLDPEGIDDDADGATNCDDLDCQVACSESGPRCADGVDNDADELIDCEDPDCATELVCESSGGEGSNGGSGTG